MVYYLALINSVGFNHIPILYLVEQFAHSLANPIRYIILCFMLPSCKVN